MAAKNQNTFPMIIQFILLSISASLYFLLTRIDDFSQQMVNYYIIIVPLYLIYFNCVLLSLKNKEGKAVLSFPWIVFFAVFFRLCLLPAGQIAGVQQDIPIPVVSLILQKIIFIMAECGLVFVFLTLLKYFRLPSGRIVILIFNPLLITELYYFTQSAAIFLLFFWTAVLLVFKKRPWYAIPLFSLSSAGIFVTIAAALPFLIRKLWLKCMLLIAVSTCLFFIFNSNLSFFRIGSNGFIYMVYKVIEGCFSGSISSAGYNAGYVVIMILVFLIVSFDQMKKVHRFEQYPGMILVQASFIISSTALLFLPALPPWLLLLIVPYMVLIPKWSWLGFTFLIQLSYRSCNESSLIWSLAIYLPFFAILLAEYLDRRKIKGWFL